MSTPQIKAVLFDLDDTLWPIVPVIQRAEVVLRDWLTQHAPEVTRLYSNEQLRAIRMRLLEADPTYRIDLGRLRLVALSEAFDACGADLALIDPAMAVFARARNAVTPFADVLPGLTQLALRVKVGSISNGVADLEEIGIAHHFHYSIAAHQSGTAKPDPVIFHRACDALGVLPSEAVYVGDDPVLDVEGAQKAGLRAVWMDRSAHGVRQTLPPHIRPDAICTSLVELEKWLNAHI
jgi:HAD superfamily hydrolase (TIGR01509 family)